MSLEWCSHPEHNCSRNEYTQLLADLLFGRTRGAILAVLYGKAGQSFYTRQIAREVDGSVGAVQRELENLSKVGLIVRSDARVEAVSTDLRFIAAFNVALCVATTALRASHRNPSGSPG